MDRLAALSALLARASLQVASFCLAVLGAVVIYGVVLRYAFNASQPYVEQVALLLLWGSAHMAESTWHNTIPTLGISEAFRYLPPIAAGLLIGLFSLERLLAPHRLPT